MGMLIAKPAAGVQPGLLTLTFERGTRLQDFVGEMLWGCRNAGRSRDWRPAAQGSLSLNCAAEFSVSGLLN